MFKNYLKVALRQPLENKGYSAINIFWTGHWPRHLPADRLYVTDELSYDRHFKMPTGSTGLTPTYASAAADLHMTQPRT